MVEKKVKRKECDDSDSLEMENNWKKSGMGPGYGFSIELPSTANFA